MKIKFLDNEIKCLLTKNQSEKLLFEVLRHYGDMITFDLTVYNQGNVPSTKIKILETTAL